MSGASPFSHVHLQWFAAADAAATEPPSELRLRAARASGQVARSPALPSALALLGGVLALALLGTSLIAAAGSMLRHFLAGAGALDVTVPGAVAPSALGYLARLALPVAALALAGALGGSLAQGGARVAAGSLVPDASRVAPRWGRLWRRAFSVEAAFDLVTDLLKVALVGAIAALAAGTLLERLAGAPLAAGAAELARAALRCASQTAVALLALALLDYAFRRYRLQLRLRMAPREMREERRRQEGDPAVRERLRARMRELLQRTVGAQVAAADVVIAHRARRAVALRWDGATMSAPVVVAKGMADRARRIGALALAHGVTVVENRPLAAALWNAAAVGDPIPEPLYRPAAALLADLRRSAPGGTAWRT